MLDPEFFTSTAGMRRYRGFMTEPCPSRKPRATLAKWGIVLGEDGALRMRGMMSGHPEFEGVGIITGPIWQLNIEKRLMRTAERWFTLDRGYHEDVSFDIEVEAIGPVGHYVAPCVAKQYLENMLRTFVQELAIY